MLLWSICTSRGWHGRSSAPPWAQRRGAPAPGQNWALIILHRASCGLWKHLVKGQNVPRVHEWMVQAISGSQYMNPEKKILCWPSLSTSTHRLDIKMWESPPLVPLSVQGNKMQEDITLPVTQNLLSIEWNTENSLTFRWADNFKILKKCLEEWV